MERAFGLRGVLDLKGGYSVIASLPKNALSLATQAEEAGVDAIMLNIEGEDSANPGHYGSYDLHDVYIHDVISTVAVPCGICIGGARPLTTEYWERIMGSQFAFVDMYAHHMPFFVLSDSRVQKIAAISTGYILEQVKKLSELDGVDALDVAVVPPQTRGSPYTALDFATTALIAGISSKPVFLRTQKRVEARDLVNIMKAGLSGLIVDPSILTGPDEAYRQELLSLSPRRRDSDSQQ